MGQDLQQNRYDQLLRRVGGLVGPGSKVNEVLGELFPVLDVESNPGELFWLGGKRLCWGSAVVTAAATFRPRVQLFNPIGSGKIIAVSSCFVSSPITQQVNWQLANAALGTGLGTELFRDSRGNITERPTGQIRTQTPIAAVGATGNVLLLANNIFPIVDENSVSVLTPGFGMSVGGTTIAGTIHVAFNWREREVEQSELNF